ncbi:AAA family ATPase [Streptomyces sp. MUM 203J]|uniref:AAA family ATPase n=1 Tax=Streptomyces sp. MUM 203J TaxID=2791990 RepID=UPI001F03C2C9|nr:LuxR family transcriptional regulator [Streptomyces sp. MUM 203J]MCH0542083.1 AAA family ATPase [Streptomyces sp. MUM 203J]
MVIPALIARDRELRRLRRLVEEPGPARVLVSGAPGAGKTPLLREIQRYARGTGRDVLTGCCDPADHRSALELARQLSRSPAGPPGRPRSAVRGMLSALTDIRRPPPPPPSADDVPTLIVVDDLQWADPASLHVLHGLMRAAGSLPLTLVAALGPGDPADERALGSVLELFDDRLRLAPLGAGALRDELSRALGQPPGEAFLRECHAATAGSHYFSRALVQAVASRPALHEDGAHAVIEAAARDASPAARSLLRRLAPGTSTVADAMAVLDTAQQADLVAAAAGVREDIAADAVNGLVRVGLAHDTDEGARLSCPLLAASLACSVLPSRRREYHARAARLLLGRSVPPEQVSRHLLLGPPGINGATAALRRAASTALARGDTAAALACLRRTLLEPLDDRERCEVLAEIGYAELDLDVPTAVRDLRNSLDLAETPEARTVAARHLAAALFAVERYDDTLSVLRSTSRRVRPQDPDYAFRLEIDYLLAALGEETSAARTRHRLRELDLSHAPSPATERPLAALLSFRGAVTGQGAEQVVEWAHTGLAHGMSPEDDESLVYSCAVLALGAAGRPDLSHAYADTAADRARADSSVLQYAKAVGARANANCRMGRFTDARADAEAGLAALLEIGVDHRHSHSAFAVATLAETLIRQGRADEAEALLADSGLDGPLGAHMINDYPLLVRGWLHAARGRPEKALADLTLCGDRSTARGMPGPGLYPWRSEAARVHLVLGNRAQALALSREELVLAREWNVPEMTAVALCALGQATGGEEGLRMLDEAADLLAPTPARFRYAQTQADRGVLAVRCGQLTAARPHLREAISVAYECGAETVAEHALAALRSLGDRPRTPTFRGRGALTPSERRAAELAAQGMTNTEIAARLFVGLRTVETHLTRAYRKLGIEGRHALPDALS